MRNKIISALILILLATATIARASINAAGDRDLTFAGFSDDGVVQIDTMTGRAIAVQSTGRILIGGQSGNGIKVKRFHPDGSADLTFGNSGTVILANSPAWGGLADIAIQYIDDKIILAGTTTAASSTDFIVARLEANGALDTSFGLNGVQTIDFEGHDDQAAAVAVQFNNHIVIAGTGYNEESLLNPSDRDFAIARLDVAGNMDLSFDTDGKRFVEFVEFVDPEDDELFDLLIQPDNKIVVAGSERDGNNDDFGIIRLNNDGSLDNTFHDDGLSSFGLGENDVIYSANPASRWTFTPSRG